jgi:hypothetical protein
MDLENLTAEELESLRKAIEKRLERLVQVDDQLMHLTSILHALLCQADHSHNACQYYTEYKMENRHELPSTKKWVDFSLFLTKKLNVSAEEIISDIGVASNVIRIAMENKPPRIQCMVELLLRYGSPQYISKDIYDYVQNLNEGGEVCE